MAYLSWWFIILVNWHSYNESLVRRGEVMLDFDVIDSWEGELTEMNNGKVGEPYDYPDSFIQLLGDICEHISTYHTDKHRVVVLLGLMLVQRYPQYRIIVQLADVSINWWKS